jgi:tRNA (cytidine/uridine-2'-O-)-methyltransferase
VHVVLVAPEIATNTGNVIRLCANAGAMLHLVEPLGFSLEERRLRRAGLDYHELTPVSIHPDLPAGLAAIGAPADRVFALSGRGRVRFDEIAYRRDDVLVFGAEGTGLPHAVLAGFPSEQRVVIPMRPGNRSLNLANAVAVVVYEAWRQLGFAGAAAASESTGTISETTAPGRSAVRTRTRA